jgi:hypothetical protein
MLMRSSTIFGRQEGRKPSRSLPTRNTRNRKHDIDRCCHFGKGMRFLGSSDVANRKRWSALTRLLGLKVSVVGFRCIITSMWVILQSGHLIWGHFAGTPLKHRNRSLKVDPRPARIQETRIIEYQPSNAIDIARSLRESVVLDY